MDRVMLSLEAVRSARKVIAGRLHRTPLVPSTTLSRMTGRPIHLKLENLQKTGSFKPRGALNSIEGLDHATRARGVITISAGNHAQGVAWAAREVGIPAVVVMPAGASALKAEAARGYGAEVIMHGAIDETFLKLAEVRAERGLAFIHPFDAEATMAGQATVGMEIMEDLPEARTVVVGIGGGGLIGGVAFAVKSLSPSTRVIGVEPTGAAAMHLSRLRGAPARLEKTDTIADGLAAPFAGEACFAIVREYVDDLVLVTDDEIRHAMKLLLERCKLLAEPAGAAALAAVLSGRIAPRGDSDQTVVIVSGGNISMDVLARLIGD